MPTYISELLTPYMPARPLQSMDAGLLTIPEVQKKSAGHRAITFHAPSLWNGLPLHVRETGSVEIFKSRFKSFFIFHTLW